MYSVYHPLRGFQTGEDYPVIKEAKGITMKDINGKEYNDFISGLWNVPLGYSCAPVINAIKDQLDKLTYLNLFSLSGDVVLQLSNKLYEITDKGYAKTIYTCTGSESVEVGIKLAHKYQHALGNGRRKYIVVFDISYHGSYYGSMSASGIDYEFIKDGYGQILKNFLFLDSPKCSCCKSNNIKKECIENMIENLTKVFQQYKDEIAAVIIEPIIGSGGIIEVPKEYMEKMKNLCDEDNILLIFDEVATGFCRTGKMFAYQHYNIRPDILMLSKGINNGYLPMGVTLVNEKVIDILGKDNNVFLHLSTQNGNPICCASAIATIEEYNTQNYSEVVTKKGEIFRKILEDRIGKYPSVFEIRQIGLMFAIELSTSKDSMERLDSSKIESIITALRKRGILVYGYYTKINSGINLMPAFITNEDQWEKAVKGIEVVLKRLC